MAQGMGAVLGRREDVQRSMQGGAEEAEQSQEGGRVEFGKHQGDQP